MWKHYMGYKMMDWPDLGSAINSKKKVIIEKPDRSSVWSGTNMHRYTFHPTSLTELDTVSTERWARDMNRYTDALPLSRKTKPPSVLSSVPRSRKKHIYCYAPNPATMQPAKAPHRTTSS